MKQQIEQLQKSQDELRKDMKELLALANKSKGGLWAGMAIASFIGGVVSIAIRSWMS